MFGPAGEPRRGELGGAKLELVEGEGRRDRTSDEAKSRRTVDRGGRLPEVGRYDRVKDATSTETTEHDLVWTRLPEQQQPEGIACIVVPGLIGAEHAMPG